MGDDATAGPSLIQAHAEHVHREHSHVQHHVHQHLHHRRADPSDPKAVTEVTTTVSVVRQVDVDSSGSTIAIHTVTHDSSDTTASQASVPTDSTVPALAAPSPPVSTTPVTPTVAPVVPTTSGTLSVPAVDGKSSSSSPITSAPSQNLPSSQASALTSTPLLATSSILGSTPGLNSSIPASGASLLSTTSAITSHLSSNHTLPSSLTASKSATDDALSTRTGTESRSGLTSTIPSFTSGSGSGTNSLSRTVLSTSTSTQTGAITISTDASGNPIIVGTGATGGNSPASTSGAAGLGTGGGNDSTPSTPVLVGGVVGGIAGVAFILVLLLFIVRWKKRNRGLLSLDRGGESSARAIASGNGGGPSQPGEMNERSLPFAIPTALASLTGRNKRESHAQSASSTAGSERGFYRVSGRKLPSVLQSGGDGYGHELNSFEERFNPDTLSGTSFYRDSQGFHGGPGLSSAASSTNHDSGIPIMRPSPARTPVTQDGAFAPPIPPPPIAPPRRPDSLGRSHPSQDGSHTSKFTEEIV